MKDFDAIKREINEAIQQKYRIEARHNSPIEMDSLKDACSYLESNPHHTLYSENGKYYVVGITYFLYMQTAYEIAKESICKTMSDSGATKDDITNFIHKWKQRNKKAGGIRPWVYENE